MVGTRNGRGTSTTRTCSILLALLLVAAHHVAVADAARELKFTNFDFSGIQEQAEEQVRQALEDCERRTGSPCDGPAPAVPPPSPEEVARREEERRQFELQFRAAQCQQCLQNNLGRDPFGSCTQFCS